MHPLNYLFDSEKEKIKPILEIFSGNIVKIWNEDGKLIYERIKND